MTTTRPLPATATWAALLLASTTLAGNALAFEVADGEILEGGEKVRLYGVNWFGAETHDHAPHGLWARNYRDMVAQIKALGFNAVRLPLCPATLDNAAVSSIDYSKNPELQGLGGLQVLDRVIDELDRSGLYVLLDHHRPDCNAISELWYVDGYSEQDWIDDLVFVAERYRDRPHFIGIDLKNEPHGAASWGSGDRATDWDQAAARAAAAILAANPDILIFVEGIQHDALCSAGSNHWWGGNLEPQNCFPLDIPADRLVFSPHVYGPDVYAQPYFDDPNFPANLPAIWDQHFGFLADQGRVIAPGEFGGRYGHGGDPKDIAWQDSFIDYLSGRGVCNFFYWSWNPNSGDTGGILQDDWQSVWQDKLANLQRLMTACSSDRVTACSDQLDNDGDGLVDLADPGCSTALDNDETDPAPDPDPTPDPSQCSDGLDNDADGLIDLADPGCADAADDDETNPPNGQPAEVVLSTQSDWGQGYCADGQVTNRSASTLTWVVPIDVDGSITDFWNGVYRPAGDRVEVRGVDWNAELAPGQSTRFGFCAKRAPTAPAQACGDGLDNDADGLIDLADPGCSGPEDNDEQNPGDPADLTVALLIDNDWGSGYCARVAIRNAGGSPVDWAVDLPVDGHTTSTWNAVADQRGDRLYLEGLDWNNLVPAGGSVDSVGFCAAR